LAICFAAPGLNKCHIFQRLNIKLQQFKDLRKTVAQLWLKFIVTNQKHLNDGNPYLRHDCISAGSQEDYYYEARDDPF